MWKELSRLATVSLLMVTGMTLAAALTMALPRSIDSAAAAAQGCGCPDICEEQFCSPIGCIVTGPTDYCTYPDTGCPEGEVAEGSCCQIPGCPIAIDVAGDGLRLTAPLYGTQFPIGPTELVYQVAWTEALSDDAWLVLDRNNNGTIDNGTELFGNFAQQPPQEDPWARHGFLALAEYDKPESGGNADGVVDSADAIFRDLRLWNDVNHDGRTDPGELRGLAESGITEVSLNFSTRRQTDENGKVLRYWSRVRGGRDQSSRTWAVDVYLNVARMRTTQGTEDGVLAANSRLRGGLSRLLGLVAPIQECRPQTGIKP